MVATRTFKKKMYVFQCFTYLCVCVPLISLVPSEALEALELELQVVVITRGVREPKWGPQEEQPVFLASEPSPQPQQLRLLQAPGCLIE